MRERGWGEGERSPPGLWPGRTPHPDPRTHQTPLASSGMRPARGEGL
ncbi:hypothetical protein [Azospirillum doebereinerae]